MAWCNLNGGAAAFYASSAEVINSKLTAAFTEELPTATFENDFTSDIGWVGQTRCTAALEDEAAALTTGSNAANLYAYAYYDLSSVLTDETTTAVIEYDAIIPSGSRAKFSLIDISARTDDSGNIVPGSSSKDSYDSTGIAFRFGEYNSGYAMLQDTTPSCTFSNVYWHFKFIIDNEARTIEYTISEQDSGTVLFTGTTGFYNADAAVVSGIEMYGYVNSVTVYFDNLEVTANYGADDTTLYIVGDDNSGYMLYVYKDGEPVAVEGRHTYSTTPVQVGTWYDGTPVWRQAFEFTFTEADMELEDMIFGVSISVTDTTKPILIGGDAWVRVNENPSIVDDWHAEFTDIGANFTIPSGLSSILKNDVSGAYGWIEFVTAASNIK